MGRNQASTLSSETDRKRPRLSRFSLVLLLCACVPLGRQGTRAQSAGTAPELLVGTPIVSEIAAGQTRTYQIALRAGQFALITVQQRGIDLVETVFAPPGDPVARFDSAWESDGADHVEFVAETSGVYRVEVSAKINRVASSFEIVLSEIRAANDRDWSLHKSNRLATECVELSRAGKYGEALAAAARALEAGEKALGPNDARLAMLLRVLGRVQRETGNYGSAEMSFQRALAISNNALGPEHPLTAQALESLGTLYVVKQEYGKAGQLLPRAVGIHERTLGAEHPAYARSLSSLGGLHLQMSDFDQAEREMKRALAILESTNDPGDLDLETARVLNNLGNLYLLKRDYERAQPLEERAVTLYERFQGPESPLLVYPLLNLGRIAHERLVGRDLARALEMYARALRLLEKSAEPDQLVAGSLLNNMANVYKAKRDYDTPLPLYERVLNIAETSGGPYHGLTIVSLGNIANLYIARRDIGKAIPFQLRVDEHLEGALALNLAIGSERQKLAYFRSFAERTDRAISLHLRFAPNDPTTAAHAALVLLQRKGRILDAVSGSLTALRQRFDTTDQRLLDRLNATTAQLAKLALSGPQKTDVDVYWRQLRGLEEEKEHLEADMSERSAEFRAQSQEVSLAAVQASIPPNAALVEFAVYRPFDPASEMNTEAYGPAHYAVCVVHRDDHVQWRDLGEAQDIDATVDQLRRALRDPKRNDVRELARLVDERVMRPVRALLDDADQLLVSPDSDLNLIPFEALVDEHGRYLVERYSFTYLTSGRDLLRLQIPRATRSAPVVMANPAFGEPSSARDTGTTVPTGSLGARQRTATNADDLSSVYFAPLSGTAEESRAIKRLYPEARVYTQDQATESALRHVEAPSILHLATHGFFLARAAAPPSNPATTSDARAISATANIDNPLLRSGLALAGANVRGNADDDGIVTALEASSLNLWGTKLVTLSACDSGVGEVKNGEGVYGLRRAFVLAGTETLVMSLWPVSDHLTRELMTAYYTGLKRGEGRGQALREVQLQTLKRKGREHPFYWASFIQSGEWADLEGRRH